MGLPLHHSQATGYRVEFTFVDVDELGGLSGAIGFALANNISLYDG